MKRNKTHPNIKKSSQLLVFLSCILISLPALSQETKNQKIPIEIIEDTAAEVPLKTTPHHLALGVNIDPFPTALTAASRDFGLALQPWFGIDNVKLRIDIAHFHLPDSLAGSSYFHKCDINTFSFIAEYIFNKNFEGFRIGAGLGIWQTIISHKYLNAKGNSITPYITVEGGYIWKFHQNLYIEPGLSLNVMLDRQTIKVYGYTYKQIPLSGEITLKFGLYVDL